MRVINRYLLTLFLKNLGLCLACFLALYLVVDFIEKISNFLGHGTRFWSICVYFLAQIPNVAVLLVPVATLASVLITLVLLARNSEIVAFKGSGISLWSLSLPFLGAGLLLSVAVFLLGNFVTPRTSETANKIWDGEVLSRRAEVSATIVEDVWSRDLRLLEHFATYDGAKSTATGVSVILLDENMFLERRIEAASATFSPEGALFRDAEVKTYHGMSPGAGPKGFYFERLPEFRLPGLPMPPPGLGRHSELNPDEMSVGELSENIRLLRAEGFNPVRQVVDLYFKFSRPFTTLIMVIVGLPIGFWREKGGSIAMGLVPGLILSFAYLVTLELSRTIGYAGFLPPLLAAWLPNCFYLLLGVYLFSYVRQ
ncbi:MAG: LptF/LptG family permease [Deltaproteobacteria bacterium]|nr:LptF/LptG family permease [Deltaproteobacteria bacterium]